ncbi:unnamed protein product, partial [Staurois parvus]
CVLPVSAQHCDPVPAVSGGHSETPIAVRNLRPISDHMILTSLLTTCEICE